MHCNLNISFQSLFLCLMILACNDAGNNVKTYDSETGILVKINYPAGDYAPHFKDNYLPAPFNLGQHENNNAEFIVLSNRIGKGNTIRVKPIACLEMIDSVKQNFIIAVPSDSTKRIPKIENYGMLATAHPHVKNLIEYWIKGTRESQNVRLVWTSEQKALELMD